MRILKTKAFSSFLKKEKVKDKALLDAVREIEDGLIGDPLGSSAYKKRVAKPGKGKSGGFRTIHVFRNKGRVIFVQGYAKNEKSTLTPKELKVIRTAATTMLKWTDKEIDKLVKGGVLGEMTDGKK